MTIEIDGDLEIDLGRCCACGRAGPTVRNVVMLPRFAPIPGTGWGCVVCGLPPDGAVTVLCDGCLVARAEPACVCRGFAASKLRTPAWELAPGVFDHDPAKHPECGGGVGP